MVNKVSCVPKHHDVKVVKWCGDEALVF